MIRRTAALFTTVITRVLMVPSAKPTPAVRPRPKMATPLLVDKEDGADVSWFSSPPPETPLGLLPYGHPIQSLLANGDLETVRRLLDERYIDPNAFIKAKKETLGSSTLLVSACALPSLDMVQMLVEKQADVNLPSTDKWTALMAAAFDGRVDNLQYLIDQKADLNVTNMQSRTALWFAASRGFYDAVKCLVDAKADVTIPDKKKATALRVVNGRKNAQGQILTSPYELKKIRSLLSAASHNVEKLTTPLPAVTPEPKLWRTSADKTSTTRPPVSTNAASTFALLGEGNSVSETNNQVSSPAPDVSIVSPARDLDESEWDVVSKSSQKAKKPMKMSYAPVMSSAGQLTSSTTSTSFPSPASVSTFASISTPAATGDAGVVCARASTYMAAEAESKVNTDILLSSTDKNPTAATATAPTGDAPACGGIGSGAGSAASLPSASTAPSDKWIAALTKSKSGKKAKTGASSIRSQYEEFTSNSPGMRGYRMLAAAMLGDWAEVSQILEEGISVDSYNGYSWTALHYACSSNNMDAFSMLMNYNPRVDIHTAAGRTPLLMAVTVGNVEMVQRLLDAKATLEHRDREGRTALYLAVDYGAVAVAKVLVERKADVSIRMGETAMSPMELAMSRNNEEMVRILEKRY